MSLPEYSLKNRKVVWFFLFVLLAGGALGFVTLGKKEDSVFVIKSASLVCSYPGATPLEVEQLVTEPIEREVQSMRLVHKITSESYYGLSKVLVELDPATRASEIPQLWDELRRKVLNIQPRLPAGASPVTVADDFGDVYGIYYGLSVDGGFTWAELRDWAQRIKTALVTVDGVQKVSLFGEQTPVVNVYVNLAALANFAIRPETIVATIGQQNTIVNSGEKQAGALQIQILEAGTYKGLDDISNQMLTAASGKQYRLGDIARVERGYADPPQTLMRVDGRRAVGIGISTEAQVDVVKTGEKIIHLIFLLSGIVAVAFVLLISIYLILSGLPAIRQIGLFQFLLGKVWDPTNTTTGAQYGILPFILTSVYGTAGAIVIGVPVGLLTAVFLAKVAPPKLAAVIRTAVQLLAGIPSVVYGLVGMIVLVPAIRNLFHLSSGACLLAAMIVLAIMILPSIINVSDTALRAVPKEYEEASLALGAAEMETYFRVSLHAARSGIAAAVVLGVGRAIGEAMAIILVAGNVSNMPGLFTPVRFLTTGIISGMAYASVGSLYQQALYSIGLVLFLFIMLINVFLNVCVKNRKEG